MFEILNHPYRRKDDKESLVTKSELARHAPSGWPGPPIRLGVSRWIDSTTATGSCAWLVMHSLQAPSSSSATRAN